MRKFEFELVGWGCILKMHNVSAGEVAPHALKQGDAILFRSEKHHNVTTVREGKRQSLVIELWLGPENTFDRNS